MNKISVYPKSTLRISKRTRRAVSPVVATLVLIVIAIVGAVGVGLILSNVSHSVGNQAAGGGNGQSAQNTLLLGGSTTLFPADEAAIKPFQAAYPGIKVVDAQGGSDAGMQGILSGALDIGAASSISAVNNLFNAVSSNHVNGVSPNVVLVGGSGVVFGTTSTCTLAVGGLTCTAAGAIQASPLADGAAGNTCLEVSRDALAQMYVLGVFYIKSGSCAGPWHHNGVAAPTHFLDFANVTNNPADYGPFVAVSRSDFGGAEDTACGYLNGDSGLSYSGGSGICGASANVGSGNLGVLTTTQACTAAGTGKGVTPVGCIGFFDLGFAEGKSAQAAATCASSGGSKPCNIFISEVSTAGLGGGAGSISGAIDALQRGDKKTANDPTKVSSYAFTNMTTSNIDTFIKSALKTASTQDPQTLQYSQDSSKQTFFPDAAASSAKNPLDRTFYYVTNGTPTPAEQDWITFMTNYNAETYWIGAGYFSQYDFTSA